MKFWISAAVVLGLAALTVAGVRNDYFYFASYVVLQFVILATAWNILGGYAGYVNFGTGAFFGVGAYTSVLLVKSLGLPLGVQILVAAAMGAALGFGVGLLTLRLRGIFFSIATVALAIILETVVVNWRYLGGATGVQLLRPPVTPPFDSYIRMLFFLMVALAIVGVAIARYIERSWMGRGLRAIRDSEEAAECSGVPTLKLKLAACVISGALMSAAGAPLPMYQSFVEPASTFSLNYSVSALAMPIIGGTAHWIGPVIGAILLGTIQQLTTVFISSELNVLVVGVLLVLFVILAPEGIVGLWQVVSGARTLAAEDRRQIQYTLAVLTATALVLYVVAPAGILSILAAAAVSIFCATLAAMWARRLKLAWFVGGALLGPLVGVPIAVLVARRRRAGAAKPSKSAS